MIILPPVWTTVPAQVFVGTSILREANQLVVVVERKSWRFAYTSAYALTNRKLNTKAKNDDVLASQSMSTTNVTVGCQQMSEYIESLFSIEDSDSKPEVEAESMYAQTQLSPTARPPSPPIIYRK